MTIDKNVLYNSKPYTKGQLETLQFPKTEGIENIPFKEPIIPYLPVIGTILHHILYGPWVGNPWNLDGSTMRTLKEENLVAYEGIVSRFAEFELLAREKMPLPREGYNFLGLQEVCFTYSKEQRERTHQLFNRYHFWNVSFPENHEYLLEATQSLRDGKTTLSDLKQLLLEMNDSYVFPDDESLIYLLNNKCLLEEIKNVLCNYSQSFHELDDDQYKALASYEYYFQNITIDSLLKKLPTKDQQKLKQENLAFHEIRSTWQEFYPVLEKLSDESFLSFMNGERCDYFELMGACSSRVDLIRISWDPTIDQKIAQFLPILEDVIKGNVRGRTPLNDLTRLSEQKVTILENNLVLKDGKEIFEIEKKEISKLDAMEQFWHILLGDPELIDKLFVEIYEMKMKTTYHIDEKGNSLSEQDERKLECAGNRRFIREMHKEMGGTIRPILRNLLVTLPKDMRNFDTFQILFQRLEKTILAYSVKGQFRIAPNHIRFPNANAISSPAFIDIEREELHWFLYKSLNDEWDTQTAAMQEVPASDAQLPGINDYIIYYPQDLLRARMQENRF